jgi:hypothetical protein
MAFGGDLDRDLLPFGSTSIHVLRECLDHIVMTRFATRHEMLADGDHGTFAYACNLS